MKTTLALKSTRSLLLALALFSSTFAQAADPFAKAVVFSEILTGNSGNTQMNVQQALGPSDGDFVSLGGPGGSIIVDMGADTPITDGPGPDLEVREIGSAFGGVDEAYHVLVSNSPETNSFIYVGDGRALSLIDISPASLESARYVWLQDIATETLSSSTPGSDIDSFRSLHFAGGDGDVPPPAGLNLRFTGQGAWLSWDPSSATNLTGYAIRRSLDGISFGSTPDATLSSRETAWHDLNLPGVTNVYYAVSALAGGSESILAVIGSSTPEIPILTNAVAHLGDDTVSGWEVPAPEREIALTFTLDGFATGPSAQLVFDLWDGDSGNTPVFLNGARLGNLPNQASEIWEPRRFVFAAGALQPGLNTLVLGGATGTLDDLQIRNIRLQVHAFQSGGTPGVITNARFTEIAAGQTEITLRWVVEQTPSLTSPNWEVVSDPIEWTGEITSSNGFYRLREP